MKVVMTVELEVDLDDWELEFGERRAAEVRKDVKSYFEHNVLRLTDIHQRDIAKVVNVR